MPSDLISAGRYYKQRQNTEKIMPFIANVQPHKHAGLRGDRVIMPQKESQSDFKVTFRTKCRINVELSSRY